MLQRWRDRRRQRVWSRLRPDVQVRVDGREAVVVRPIGETMPSDGSFRSDQFLVRYLDNGQESFVNSSDHVEIIA